MNDFQIIGQVVVDSSGAVGLRTVNDQIDRMQAKTSTLSNATKGFGDVAKFVWANVVLQGVNAAGRALAGMAGEALNATAEWERMGMTMESLVAREIKQKDTTLTMADALKQAGGRAQDLLGWVQELAIKSPFDVEGVATAFRTAMAYGFTSETAQRLTQNMIDFASGSGQSVDVMNSIALALGQVSAKGKLSGQEILQLVNAGVPVNDMLKQMGFTLDDVSNGLVSADAFIEQFSKTMESDFGGAAQRQSESWSGLMNTLGDVKKIGLRTFFEGAFTAMKPFVTGLASWLQGEGMEKIKQWGQAFGDFVQRIVAIAQAFQGLLANSRGLTSGFTTMVNNGLNFFSNWWQVNGASIMASAQSIFKSITGGLTLLAAKIGPFIKDVLARFAEWFTRNGPLIRRVFAQIATGVQQLMPVLVSLWSVVRPILSAIIDLVLGLVEIVMDIFVGDWQAAWEKAKEVVASVGQQLWQAIVALLETIAMSMGTSLAELGAQWKGIWNMFLVIVKGYWNLLVLGVKNWLMGMWTPIVTWWNNLIFTIRVWMTIIKDVFALGWQYIKEIFATALLIVLGLVFTILDEILENFGTSISEIVDVVSNGFEAIKEFIVIIMDIVKTFINNKWREISTNTSARTSEIKTKVTTTFTAMKTAVQTILTNLVTAFRTAFNNIKIAVSTKMNEVVTEMKSRVGSLLLAITSRLTEFYNMGKNIVNALKTGITNAWAAFSAWFKGIIQSLIDKALETLGISSPSRVFMEIGKAIPQGLAVGILRDFSAPIQALTASMASLSSPQTLSPAFAASPVNRSVVNTTHNYFDKVVISPASPQGGNILSATRKEIY